MKPCRSCRYALDGDDAQAFCHGGPPTALSAAASAYPCVALDKPGCSLHRQKLKSAADDKAV